MKTLVAVGAVFVGPGSGMVSCIWSFASPEFPLAPLAATAAMSTVTAPLPDEGAVQSKAQER